MAELSYYEKCEKKMRQNVKKKWDKQHLTFLPLGLTLVENSVGI